MTIHAINSANARKGKSKSPWARGPHVDSPAAKLSYLRYCKKSKQTTNLTEIGSKLVVCEEASS